MTRERERFVKEVTEFWTRAMEKAAGKNSAQSMTWSGLDNIRTALEPFMGDNKNHAHLPTGGGLDMRDITKSTETDCLEFRVGRRAAPHGS